MRPRFSRCSRASQPGRSARQPVVAQSKKIDLRTTAGTEAGQRPVAVSRRQDHRGGRQEQGRLAQQDVQLRAQGEGPGVRRQRLGGHRARDAQECPGERPDLLLLVPDQGDPAARGRGQVGLLPDDGGRLRRGLGRRQAPAQAGRHGRADRRRLQLPQPRRAQGRRAGQDLPARRSSASTGRSPTRPRTGSSWARRSWSSSTRSDRPRRPPASF